MGVLPSTSVREESVARDDGPVKLSAPGLIDKRDYLLFALY